MAVDPEDTGLTHISIKNCEFNDNGSSHGPAVILALFNDDLVSIFIENNVFKHNSSHEKDSAIVKIYNSKGISDAEQNGE